MTYTFSYYKSYTATYIKPRPWWKFWEGSKPMPSNDLGEGRERGILREASLSTDGLEGGNGELK